MFCLGGPAKLLSDQPPIAKFAKLNMFLKRIAYGALKKLNILKVTLKFAQTTKTMPIFEMTQYNIRSTLQMNAFHCEN